MQEMQLAQEAWDIKKIVIGVVSLLTVTAGAVVVKTQVLDKSKASDNSSSISSPERIQGASTTNPDAFTPTPIPQPITLPSKTDVSKKLEEIQQQVIHLNVSDVATSSPAVQNVLNELKTLTPQNQAKDACLKICSGL